MFVIARWERRTQPFWKQVEEHAESVPAPVLALGHGLLPRIEVTPREAVEVCAWARRRIDHRRPPLQIADAAGREIWPCCGSTG